MGTWTHDGPHGHDALEQWVHEDLQIMVMRSRNADGEAGQYVIAHADDGSPTDGDYVGFDTLEAAQRAAERWEG